MEAAVSETNSNLGELQNWLSNPGNVKQIDFSVPGSEYYSISLDGKNIALEGFMYYQMGRQGASFYLRHLTNIGTAWTNWPDAGNIMGISARTNAWLITCGDLSQAQRVYIAPLIDASPSSVTNDMAVSKTRYAKLKIDQLLLLGFNTIVPGTLKWRSTNEFEAIVTALGKQTPTPTATMHGRITSRDESQRPITISFKNPFTASNVETYMQYKYGGINGPDWFPSRIDRINKSGSTTKLVNSVLIDTVVLGSDDNLTEGYVPKLFLSTNELSRISIVFSSNGLYYCSGKYGIKRIYRDSDPDSPKSVQLFSKHGRGLFAICAVIITLTLISIAWFGQKQHQTK